MTEGAHEGEPQFETECGGKQPSLSSGVTDQTAATQTHFRAPGSQFLQVIASGIPNTAAHRTVSSPEQELRTSKDTEGTSLQVI